MFIKNCNNNIIDNFLDEFNKYKCIPFRYINSNNPSDKIEIGDVKTINYDEEAKIIDEKNGNTHTLNFYIPKGMDGESSTLSVGTVTTGLPGDDAKIIDNVKDLNHTFDFVIPQGPTGPAGPITPSSLESTFFSDFNDVTKDDELLFNNIWIIPNDLKTFNVIDNKQVKIIPGIYEISISGLASGIDENNEAEIYLQTIQGTAIKDLSFKFPKGNISYSYFSKNTIYRFEQETTLEIKTNITSDNNNSLITISALNLILKKIHE